VIPPLGVDLRPPPVDELPFQGNEILMRGDLASREVADKFVEALRRLEEERDVGALVEIHTEDCDVGSVSTALRAFQHATAFGLRLSAFQLFSKSSRSLLMSVEPVRHRRWFLVRG
jgi:hypothetical protein